MIFANSVKQVDHIVFAKEKGVKLMTFDSVEEAISVHSVYPEAELILRIGVVETNAFCPMGQKFGAPEITWIPILNTCKQLNMRVRGVSFHVGSGGCDFESYEISLKDSESVFDLALKMGLPPMDILDIGGGFSDNPTNHFGEDTYMQHNSFPVVATKVNNYLKKVFPGKNKKI